MSCQLCTRKVPFSNIAIRLGILCILNGVPQVLQAHAGRVP